MNLYTMTLFKDISTVIGADPDNNIHATDFITNDMPLATKIDAVQIVETTFIINKSYEDFEALIVFPITWGDVKYKEDENSYTCYLIAE